MHMAVYMRGRWSVGLFVVYSSALDVSSLPIFFLLSDFSKGKNGNCSTFNYFCFHSLCHGA